MKLLTSIALLLTLSTPFASAKDKKKDVLPAMFSTARYVYVQAEDGDIFKPDLYPEDRQAISDVENGLSEWKRYVLTINRSEADLIFVVRKGRAVAAKVGGAVGVGSQPGARNSPAGQGNRDPGQAGTSYGYGGGVEAGMPDDTLRVFTQMPDGRLSGSPIWWREMHDGLDAPGVELLRVLRDQVDRTYPPESAKKP